MSKSTNRLGIILALLAYLQASTLTLAFVVCLDDDGGAVLEAAAGHCCAGGVPQESWSHEAEGLAASDHESDGCDHHVCPGCVDFQLLGQSRRPGAKAPTSLPATPAVEFQALLGDFTEPVGEVHRTSSDPRPPGLADFDRFVLNC